MSANPVIIVREPPASKITVREQPAPTIVVREFVPPRIIVRELPPPPPARITVKEEAPARITVRFPGPQGIQGPQGPPGFIETFVFDQAVPSDVWDIDHELGRFPSITVVDSAGSVVEGDPEYLDSNRVTVHFAGAFAGQAYLN